MSDIKIFRIDNNSVSQVEGQSMAVERSLQTLLENRLEAFLGVQLIKSEHTNLSALKTGFHGRFSL